MVIKKQIEEITDDDLAVIWARIGGALHLFEHGKDDLKNVLISGDCSESGLQLDYYTMAAIVDTLRVRGFGTVVYKD